MLREFGEPVIGEKVFISPTASVVGDVRLGEGANVWQGASIRGDLGPITIGRYSTVQESCVVHMDPGKDVSVGDYVTVGHGAVLHGCHVEDECLVGMNATVLDDVKVGKGSLIGANSLVTKDIPPNSLVMGSPGKVVKETSQDQREFIRENAELYYRLAQQHLERLR